MTFGSRLRVVFRSKASRTLDRLEDPRDALDDSYEQLVAMLQDVRRGLAEVATAKKRLELQGEELGARHARLGAQAQEALSQGREDLARTALERRSLLERQIGALREQYLGLAQQQAHLQDNERRLADRVAAFRTEKETIKATYAASEAQVRANEAAAGIGSQMSDVGVTLERATDRVAQMKARAAATDELLASGALNDLTAPPDADLERQLSTGAMRADVDRQLQAMKDARAGRSGRSADASERPGGPGGPGDQAHGWLSIGQGPAAP
ncbi:PspA/IM30 family protein [Cryobacterium sp. SO2]|uniref:PspA/IM30 family protein n=1 Tax=Cryobacterium sp. SO2 TaxID=1897060 RepID=UPI00223CA5E0|nr:PspA/IM30 family protein [Cryobacterium sp. SO2]WEO75772.1 PspA/IM30 family protein [Cryobacterium sp. SO2]